MSFYGSGEQARPTSCEYIIFLAQNKRVLGLNHLLWFGLHRNIFSIAESVR